MEKAESFEVTEYGTKHQLPDRVRGAIVEILQDRFSKNPAANVRVSFTGNLMKLTYHCYEMLLPTRMRDAEHSAKSYLDDALKAIKKEVKDRAGELPKFSEKKDMANYSVQKASLNERYMYSSWRFYELG